MPDSLKHLLLVEDEAPLRQAIAEQLGDRGYQVQQAESGEAALAHLVRPPPESSANNLLAEQLRHERPEADDVRHSAAIPAFCKHPH